MFCVGFNAGTQVVLRKNVTKTKSIDMKFLFFEIIIIFEYNIHRVINSRNVILTFCWVISVYDALEIELFPKILFNF